VAESVKLAALGDYIGGAFSLAGEGARDAVIERMSPRDWEDFLPEVPVRRLAVNEAVCRARMAFEQASRLPQAELWQNRALSLQRLRAVLAARAEELALAIVREVGKPLWEARSEVSAALAKIDVTLADGLALVQPREMAGRAQHYDFRPVGVAAVLAPFNFPLHLTHGHVVPLLATGNSVVVKPSELTPYVGQLYAECVHSAGFALGVFNMVQGEGAQGALLAAHPDVDAVMLTGSVAVGQSIKRATLEQPHKLLALELGGRNPVIVCSDADLDKAVHDTLWGAFVTAGQRCSGTAVALVERPIFERFRAGVLAAVKRIQVGDPRSEGVFMGPMISEAARSRYVGALERAELDGVERLWSGPAHPLARRGAYIQPSVHYVESPRGLAYETEELFGPNLALECVEDVEHAVARANASPYGLSVSVFSQDAGMFERLRTRLRYGCVNLNTPTCGASARLPFGGTRSSGNQRPAALFSTLYSTYPVATLEGPATLLGQAFSPGFGFEPNRP
jgi:succinylglutamic semialdehyde dehydrogenase